MIEQSNADNSAKLNDIDPMALTLNEYFCPTSTVSRADNQSFIEFFVSPLNYSGDETKLSLKNIYVSPKIQNSNQTAENVILEWFEDKGAPPCLLLYGAAGIGKTSLVAKLIMDAEENRGFGPNATEVLAVKLRNHSDNLYNAKNGEEILTQLFNESAEKLSNYLLILDGLDEFCSSHLDDECATILKLLSEIKSGFHVLVTSRSTSSIGSYLGISGLRAEQLCWNENEVMVWCSHFMALVQDHELQAWCASFLKWYNTLSLEDERRPLFCSPLFLRLCYESRLDLKAADNIATIYDYIFRAHLLRTKQFRYKDGKAFLMVDAESKYNLIVWQYTKEVAYQMFLLDSFDLVISDDTNNLQAKGLKNAWIRTKEILKQKYGIYIVDDDINIETLVANYLFMKIDGKGCITFFHKSVYEFFTAVKLYEDYFAKFNNSYFTMTRIEDSSKDVIEASIEAFRYKPIGREIFKYLCAMNNAPFSVASDSFIDGGLDYKSFEAAVVKAMAEGVLNTISVKTPVNEYYYQMALTSSMDSLNLQLNRAFRALLCFLTGHGFRNMESVEGSIQLPELIRSRVDQTVFMEYWHLSEINLSGAYLIRADLRGADLSWADLSGSDLTGANLGGADLTGADLTGTDLTYTNMDNAEMLGVILNDANLKFARMNDVILARAYLRGADLRGADLRGADLRGVYWGETKYNNTTRFPNDFDPKEHGLIEVEKNEDE